MSFVYLFSSFFYNCLEVSLSLILSKVIFGMVNWSISLINDRVWQPFQTLSLIYSAWVLYKITLWTEHFRHLVLIKKVLVIYIINPIQVTYPTRPPGPPSPPLSKWSSASRNQYYGSAPDGSGAATSLMISLCSASAQKYTLDFNKNCQFRP